MGKKVQSKQSEYEKNYQERGLQKLQVWLPAALVNKAQLAQGNRDGRVPSFTELVKLGLEIVAGDRPPA